MRLNASELLLRLTQDQRAWRIFLVLVFTIPVLLVLPHARSLVVRNAVITAYLGDIRAPIDGSIEEINQPPGSLVVEGKPAMSLHNDRYSRSQLARLEVLRTEAQRELEHLRTSVASMRSLAEARRKEENGFEGAIERDLARQIEQAEADASARAADVKEASANRQRATSMHERGLLSPSEVEAAESAHERALAAESANRLLRRRLEQQREETRNNIYQIGEPEGILLTRQLAQQLNVDLIQLERQLLESETEFKVLEAEWAAADKAYQRSSQADIQLRPGLTVWNVYGTRGAWVTEGTLVMSVVDCSNLMADIAVDDATLELIEPGQKVRLRLFGTFDFLDARVVLVRGSAGLRDTPVLAAELQHRGERMGRVLVDVDERPYRGEPQESCGIGRTAYAEFEGISMLETILYPLFR